MFGNLNTMKPNIPFLFNTQMANNNWMHGYTAFSGDAQNQTQINSQMYNAVFKTSEGQRFNIPFSGERTVEDLIETFFKRVDREELFKKGGIAFLYNAAQLNYHDESKIKQVFRTNFYPTVVVIDVQGLIGA